MTAPVDREAIGKWLRLLYGEAPGYISAVTIADGVVRSTFFGTDDLDAAAVHLAGEAAHANTFVSCCTLAEHPTPGHRGGADDMLAMPGVWCDLDVLAGRHHKWHDPEGIITLPATVDDALNLTDDLGLKPTAVVLSGGGAYAWWLFNSPLIFATKAERDEGDRLSRAFNMTLIELGRRRGWHVDNTSDLARVLRVPGTVNRKREPVPVRLVECHPERRYTPAELDSVCLEPIVEPRAVREPQRPVRGDEWDESPADAFARIVPWSTVLEPAGFALMYEQGETGYWHHPASTTGPRSVSATTDANGVPVLVLHSESAAVATGLPHGAGQRLTRFRTWSILHYGGDMAAATRALRAMRPRRAS